MKRFLVLSFALAGIACAPAPDTTLQGYGEADYVYIASQESGVIADLFVHEGETVEANAPVFRLRTERIDLPLQGASAQRSALAQSIEAARAQATLAHSNYQRTSGLFADGFVARARLDADRAALDAANAQLEEARRQLAASNADIGLWRERRSDLAGVAPTAGTIERVYRRVGEVVPAGQPVAALLSPANMKVRFFAPETMLGRLTLGARVEVTCDGCEGKLQGSISFIAREPQFTPPVIYSLDQRTKLVYLVEARLETPAAIRPGVPVDVHVPE